MKQTLVANGFIFSGKLCIFLNMSAHCLCPYRSSQHRNRLFAVTGEGKVSTSPGYGTTKRGSHGNIQHGKAHSKRTQHKAQCSIKQYQIIGN